MSYVKHSSAHAIKNDLAPAVPAGFPGKVKKPLILERLFKIIYSKISILISFTILDGRVASLGSDSLRASSSVIQKIH